jgi:hypothetical protein
MPRLVLGTGQRNIHDEEMQLSVSQVGEMRQKCGCYDGAYSSASPSILVSVRCVEHQEKPPKYGHSLMFRDEKGEVKSIAPRDRLEKKTISKGKVKKNAKA